MRGDAPQTSVTASRTPPSRIDAIRSEASYSILNRWIEWDLLATLEELVVGCIAFSPLAQDMPTNKYLHRVPQDARATRDGSLSQSSRIGTSPPFVP